MVILDESILKMAREKYGTAQSDIEALDFLGQDIYKDLQGMDARSKEFEVKSELYHSVYQLREYLNDRLTEFISEQTINKINKETDYAADYITCKF